MLSSRGSDISVSRFNGGPNNCTLFLRTPRDRIATKVENEGISRGKIILIDSLVDVRVGM